MRNGHASYGLASGTGDVESVSVLLSLNGDSQLRTTLGTLHQPEPLFHGAVLLPQQDVS